jgi:hypothetical protein
MIKIPITKVSQWEKFIEIINQTKIGSLITRQQILKHVYKSPVVWRKYSRATTVDRYRRSLDLLGIVDKVELGVYRVNHHVKPGVTAHKITKEAYKRKKHWKEWFMKKEDYLREFIITENDYD